MLLTTLKVLLLSAKAQQIERFRGMAKRPVLLSPDVIHKIWSLWLDGDADEDAILRRVLNDIDPDICYSETKRKLVSQTAIHEHEEEKIYEVNDDRCEAVLVNPAATHDPVPFGKVRWVDDIREALIEIGGEANLQAIYQIVEMKRKAAGRTTPKSLDATVRQSIEAHCPTSDNYKKGNGKYFAHVARGRYRII